MKLHARKDVCNPFHLSWFWWQYQDFEGNGICLDLHLMLYKTFVRYYRSMHIPQHCQGIETQFWNSKNSKRFELTSFIIFLLNEFLEFSRQSANFKVILFFGYTGKGKTSKEMTSVLARLQEYFGYYTSL